MQNTNFRTTSFTITPTLDTGSTSAGDVLCATLPANDSGQLDGSFSGELVGITVLDKADQGGALDVVLLKADTDLGTAGSAISISDSDAESILRIATIDIDDYVDLVGSQFADVDFGKPFKLTPAFQGSILYVALVSRTAGKTYGANDLVITLHLRSDQPR